MRPHWVWIATLGLFVACARPEPQADLAILNGRVYTLESGQAAWAEAVVVRGDSILYVGSSQGARRFIGPRTEVLDVQGGLVLPGFIDAHTHFLSGGFRLLGVDLRAAATERDFIGRIAEKARTLRPGQWITGGDWDHQQWPSRQLPRREWIDSVTSQTPVFVTRHDGHMGLANSLALRLAGIGRHTPDPPGGQIVRDPRTGEPTGILKDAAMDLVYRVIPEPSRGEQAEALRAAMREANRFGVTTVHNMGSWSELPVLDSLNRRGELTVRIYHFVPLPTVDSLIRFERRGGIRTPMLKTGGLKGFVDGSLGSSTALFFEPYTDDPGNRGLPNAMILPVGRLDSIIERADRAGLQVAVHAIGDSANKYLLDVFARVAARVGPHKRRFRIEHAQHLRPSEIARFAQQEVIASMQPYHAIDDGRWAERRIGPERSRYSYAFRSLLQAGAVVAFGSDWTVAPLNPILGLYAAVTRRTPDGRHPNGWVPQEKISLEDALRSYTLASAYAGFDEARLGSLRAGKWADIVVLDRDLFRLDPEQWKTVRVRYTIVAGRVVYRAGSQP
ncbi:MAG: amidohydrolase [Bacteroidota bacterium]|nr:amidohydrolase [Bacteroidota bacterium]